MRQTAAWLSLFSAGLVLGCHDQGPQSHGKASKLAFTAQPSNTAAGATFTPSIEVVAQDASGNIATDYVGTISVIFGANPSGATLSGTKSVTAVNGVARFSAVSIDKVGTGYTLTASASGLTGATSLAFNIVAGAAASIAPAGGNAQTDTINAPLPIPYRVLVADGHGNPVPNATITWTVTRGGGSITPSSITDASGIATATRVLGDSLGTNAQRAIATATGLGGSPVTFTAAATAGRPAALAFTSQPSTTSAGLAISPAVVVTARDRLGNSASTFSGTVTVAIGTNPHSGTLSGTLMQAASAGVATFSDLSIDSAGTGYTLLAVATGLSSDSSTPFNVVCVHNCWSAKDSMPTARGYLGVAVLNGAVYAVGGFAGSSNDPTSKVEAYDPSSNSWTTKASMGAARGGVAVGTVNGILYAVGGTMLFPVPGVYKAVDTVEAYDPMTNSWSPKASMPVARTAAGLGVVNGILYVVGGQDSLGQYTASLYAYDPVADNWTSKAPMPTRRAFFAVGTFNGLLYVVGGDVTGIATDVVEAYDPISNTWTAKASLPAARAELAIGEASGLLYAIGGSTGSGPVTTVEAYDPIANAWTTKASMPTARRSLGAGVLNNTLYAVGGAAPNTGLGMTTNEAYQP